LSGFRIRSFLNHDPDDIFRIKENGKKRVRSGGYIIFRYTRNQTYWLREKGLLEMG